MKKASQPLQNNQFGLEGKYGWGTDFAIAMRTTALTAPFMPGASPPLVITAILRFLPAIGGGTLSTVIVDRLSLRDM